MSFPLMTRVKPAVLTTILLVSALGSAGPALDSATSACRQNPNYCARVAGEEAVVPTIQGAAEIVSVGATLRVLDSNTQADIESSLEKCVDWANDQVNRRRFSGNSPSRKQCQEEVSGTDPCGRRMTRAMHLGTEKHALALQCAEEKLGELIPGRFSREPRYRYDPQTGQKQLVSREEARTLLQQGCGNELEGTIVPDIVIHSGNPLEALAVYDFKFPCPDTNKPTWREYEKGPFAGSTQGKMYLEILKVGPNLIAPIRGIIRWLESQK
ncbi:MAG TPA: hypothetical protein VFZ09_19700 [Archangium sp.]|uniref:hypothetical protein n=1 Tax=Archangium sp. TaxID=1872627 RepID=UPI002E310B23|nr:hypothetical protein [Archangium sp.]HEX5748473.1 hypothetical protein [Archangium sp.]